MRAIAFALPALALSAGLAAAVSAAPTDGRDPARARVAAQCAAFWEGAGERARAAPYRALAAAVGDPVAARSFVDRLRPAMARLAAERATSPRAADLWQRHARLCGAPAGPPPGPGGR